MKNLSFPAVVVLCADAKKEVKCEFRIHDGNLFWHGCPKKYGQSEYAKYCWQNNANLCPATEMTEDGIRNAVTAYIANFADGCVVDSITFGEPKFVNERARKEHDTEAAPTPKPTTEPTPEAVASEPKPRKPRKPRKPAPEQTATNEPEPNVIYGDEGQQLIALISRLRGQNVNKEVIARTVREELKKLAEKPETSELVSEAAEAVASELGDDEITCKDFDDIVQDVDDGFYPYMEGAAGCGKSYTASQVAHKLHLKFYPMQQLIFQHQVEGYGDAGGNFVATPVYKAFTEGGLVFFDEWDGSQPEAAIVINNMLANGEYTFPVVGHKKAHPKFRCIFAGNTCGKGADEEYTGRAVLDGSTRDRLLDYKMTYDHRVEMRVAKGDAETVAFIEDLRQAVAKTGIRHIISYRATAYAVARRSNMEKALLRGVVKFLEIDELRIIYEALKNKECAWAKAFANIIIK